MMIRGNIYIAHEQKLQKLLRINKPVYEYHVTIYAVFQSKIFKAVAVSLAELSFYVGMCSAKNYIHNITVGFIHFCKSIYHVFDSFAGTKKPECKYYFFSFKLEFIFIIRSIQKRY